MSLLFGRGGGQARGLGDTPNQLVPQRQGSVAGGVYVNSDTAMRHSAVWACLRLRADLISTMPLNVWRKLPDGTQAQVPLPPVLVTPGGSQVGLEEWLYSSQVDLDKCGNSVGVITALDGNGLPRTIELAARSSWSISSRKGKVTYRINGADYQPWQVWHEKQFTSSGLAVGMSPIAYGAVAIGQYLSAQQYAMTWYGNGAIPTGKLRNKLRTVSAKEAGIVKDRFKVAVANRDLFVTGSDWDYDPIQAEAGDQAFIDAMKFSISDTARFFGVPADLIDAEQSGASITYANITQRNLQFLIMNLGPAVKRRQAAFSRGLVAQPRFVQFDTDSLLQMDPSALTALLALKITSRQLAPSEVRAMDNREPFTEEQLLEFDRLFTKITAKAADVAPGEVAP